MQPVGSQGIVGNWKSRWTCMSVQEETVTTEIEKPNTRAAALMMLISACAPLSLFYFSDSLFSSSFLVSWPPPPPPLFSFLH